MTPTQHGSRVSTRELFFSAYQAARDTVTIFPDLSRTLIEIRGSRAIQVLTGLVTNTVDLVPGGRGCYTFMLGPKGRTVGEFRVLPAPGYETPTSEDEVLWIDTPSAGFEAILAHFQKYVPPIFSTYAALDVTRISLVGPLAGECLKAALETADLAMARPLEELSPLESASFGAEGRAAEGLVVRREAVEGDGFDVYERAETVGALEDGLEATAAQLGGARGTRPVWEVLRVERGIPAYPSELSADRLAQEAGQDERAISFEKGCFTGQEVVARIHYRGHVNRLLRGLRIPDGDTGSVEPGVELEREGRRVGLVGSVVESPRLGTIALAYVRREIEAGDQVGVSGGSTTALEVTGLPFT